jgi:endonuclease III
LLTNHIRARYTPSMPRTAAHRTSGRKPILRSIPASASFAKLPFDIPQMMRLIREAVKPYPKAVLFELADRGYGSAFQILIACIITIRTLEEVSLPTALKLFEEASTPAEMEKLSPQRIDELIHACTFHRPKSRTIHSIAKRLNEDFNGRLPCDFDTLTNFSGVGPKCANLVLGIAGESAGGIPVDIHVHRVTNRWGIVAEPTPQKTMAALQEALPKRYWVEINKLLVPFGKHICTGKAPRCSQCPVLNYCRQVGVTEQRS